MKTLSLCIFYFMLATFTVAQNWLTNGNSGLNGTNFIGTTDAKPLIFKTNSLERSRILSNGTWRFGINGNYAKINTSGILTFDGDGGYHVGSNQYAFRYNLDPDYGLFFNSTNAQYEFRDGNAVPTFYIKANTGHFNFEGDAYNNGIRAMAFDDAANTIIGKDALTLVTTGSRNTVVGFEALHENTMGNYNTVMGSTAMFNNTLGSSNVAVGLSALNINATGSQNVALGAHAMGSNSAGADNTVAGYYASASNTTGNENCSYGRDALYLNNTGSYNVAIGRSALFNNMSGTYNTAVGFEADVTASTFTNATAIGNNALVDASNKVRIGNMSVTSIGGQVNWSVFSDARVKKNITKNVPGLKFINLLNPVTYTYNITEEARLLGRNESKTYKPDKTIEQINFSGFLAQEVETAANKIKYDFSGIDNSSKIKALRYADFVVPLVKAVQELSILNDEKDRVISTLQQRIEKIEGILKINASNYLMAGGRLEQNIPNPFNKSTLINYTLPEKYTSAKIVLSSNNGKAIKEISLTGNSSGSIQINANTMLPGVYQYSLYVDERIIDSKQMILHR